MKHWPFKVVSDGEKPKIQVEYKAETKTFFAEEISSMVLVKMKEVAEAYIGKVRMILMVRNWEMFIFNTTSCSSLYCCNALMLLRNS